MTRPQILKKHDRWTNIHVSVVRVLLILVVATPLIISPSTFYPYEVGKAIYARFIIEVAFAIWIPLVLFTGRDYRPRFSWILVALGTWVLVSILAGAFGPDPNRSFWSDYSRMDGVVDLAHWVAYAVMLASVLRTTEQWRKLLLVWTILAGLVAMLAVISSVWSDGLSILFISQDGSRVGSTVGVALQLGGYLCISIGFAVALITLSKSFRQATPIVAVGVIIAVALWLTVSRSAMLALLVMVVVVLVGHALFSCRKIIRYAIVGGLSLILLSVILLPIILHYVTYEQVESLPVATRLKKVISGEDRSTKRRIIAAEVAIAAYKERPILGYGPDNYYLAWGRYVPEKWRIKGHYGYFDDAHAVPMEVMATTGTLGLAAYTAMFAALLYFAYQSVRKAFDPRARAFNLYMGSTLIGYTVVSWAMLGSPVFMLCLAILIGYFIRMEYQQQTPSADRRPLLRSPQFKVVVWAVVPLMLIIATVFNASVFLSAQTTIRHVSLGDDATREFIPSVYRGINAFPPMENSMRQNIVNIITQIAWDKNHPGEPLLEEIDKSIERFPHDWTHVTAAVIAYREVGDLEKSGQYLDRLEEILSSSVYVVRLREIHSRLTFERQYSEQIHRIP